MPAETIATVGEAALVERIRQRAGSPPGWLRVGIGDDAAVYAPDRNALQVVTTDGLVEDVHFDPQLTGYDAVGYKAVAVNLSDLAAMGASPRGLLLALSLPRTFPLDDFDALLGGVIEAASEARAALVGGNLSHTRGAAVVDATAFGAVAPRKLLTRAGGRAGDELYVTGRLGAAAAGLLLLRRLLGRPADRAALDARARECVRRYERPLARLRTGAIVARSRAASAAVDVSDGLAPSVRLIAEASGTGAVVHADLVPIHEGAEAEVRAIGGDPVPFALSGGEDYELLFAVPPRRRRAFLAAAGRGGVPVSRIGHLTKEPGCRLLREGAEADLGEGFTHF